VGAGRGLLPVALLAGLAVFGYVYLDGATRGNLDGSHDTFWILDDKRASIRIPFPERTTYQRITSLVRSHAKGQYTFAGPDAPQVYYLSGFRNPTRSLFDFLDTTDSARGAARLNVIAINNHPEFSDPLEASVVRRLDLLYPSHEMVDRFDVRWRN
jgi:hypothetical protein